MLISLIYVQEYSISTLISHLANNFNIKIKIKLQLYKHIGTPLSGQTHCVCSLFSRNNQKASCCPHSRPVAPTPHPGCQPLFLAYNLLHINFGHRISYDKCCGISREIYSHEALRSAHSSTHTPHHRRFI